VLTRRVSTPCGQAFDRAGQRRQHRVLISRVAVFWRGRVRQDSSARKGDNSFLVPCTRPSPDFYTNTSSNIPWLEKQGIFPHVRIRVRIHSTCANIAHAMIVCTSTNPSGRVHTQGVLCKVVSGRCAGGYSLRVSFRVCRGGFPRPCPAQP